MKYDYDIISIGLGPAGMAVSIMASSMGLKVCAIEKNKIGGECMNVGCIPSKALLRMAKTRHMHTKLEEMQLEKTPLPKVMHPFDKIKKDLDFINQNKTKKMFDKVHLVLGEGEASFVDSHTIEVNQKKYSAKKIFIATGTSPAILPIEGIKTIDYLTNENIFKLDRIPGSLTIIGGGAIGAEMAQAFSRLGSQVSIIQMDAHLLPFGDIGPGELIEKVFIKEGIKVYNNQKITKLEKKDNLVVLTTNQGEQIISEKLLLAAGRKHHLESLNLDKAGVKFNSKGIQVNNYLQTSQKHIYAVGDCNGHFLLSHAAMHQGMIALMNSMTPFFKQNFKKFVVPWTVFVDPQVSFVGMHQAQLDKMGIKYQIIESKYEDYGAAIAENITQGFVRAYVSPLGKIYGVSIVGEGSGEMINEWALAIQKKIRLHDIMMLQHSFPTMSFLNKRIGEEWMMKKMNSPLLKNLARNFFSICN